MQWSCTDHSGHPANGRFPMVDWKIFLVRWKGLGSYISENIQGGFFNCSHPKISKYKKKTKYPNCSHPKMSKCGKVKVKEQTNNDFGVFILSYSLSCSFTYVNCHLKSVNLSIFGSIARVGTVRIL